MSRSRTTTEPLRMHGFEPQDLLMRLPSHRRSTHPGAILREDYLVGLGWSGEDLALQLRVPGCVVDELLAERAPVTPELALRLAKLFSQSPAFWIKMQLAYDYWDAFRAADADLERIVPVEVQDEAEPVRKAS
jgi:addiction module HigA family antidote